MPIGATEWSQAGREPSDVQLLVQFLRQNRDRAFSAQEVFDQQVLDLEFYGQSYERLSQAYAADGFSEDVASELATAALAALRAASEHYVTALLETAATVGPVEVRSFQGTRAYRYVE